MANFNRALKRQKEKEKEKQEKLKEQAYQKGRAQGIEEAIQYIGKKVATLHEVKGVGDHLSKEISEYLGYEMKE